MPDADNPRSALADGFSAIADAIDERSPQAQMQRRLTQARELCERASARTHDTVARKLFANLQTALTTWQQVWPQLGQQAQFRQAVARESRGWAARLARD